MRYQVYGTFGGELVLIGWPRKSLSAAFSFMRNKRVSKIYSSLRIVNNKGREWFKDEESSDAD